MTRGSRWLAYTQEAECNELWQESEGRVKKGDPCNYEITEGLRFSCQIRKFFLLYAVIDTIMETLVIVGSQLIFPRKFGFRFAVNVSDIGNRDKLAIFNPCFNGLIMNWKCRRVMQRVRFPDLFSAVFSFLIWWLFYRKILQKNCPEWIKLSSSSWNVRDVTFNPFLPERLKVNFCRTMGGKIESWRKSGEINKFRKCHE